MQCDDLSATSDLSAVLPLVSCTPPPPPPPPPTIPSHSMDGSSHLWEESYEIAKISGGFEQISNFLRLKLSYVASTG